MAAAHPAMLPPTIATRGAAAVRLYGSTMVEGSGESLNGRSTQPPDHPEWPSPPIRLLGPVETAAGGQPAPLRSRHARTMLAALAVRAGELVAVDGLIDAMWDGEPPRTAAHALHVYASALRKRTAGEDVDIVGRPGGYLLRAGAGMLDTDRFEHLVARGTAMLAGGDANDAAETLRAALGLWRGPALADVSWERFADGAVRRWEELRHTARDELTDAALAMGRYAEVIGEVEALVREQPFRERRWAQLMTALHGAGRQAAALDRYRRVRKLLADELGVDPSAELREVHTRILRQQMTPGLSAVRRTADRPPVTRFARGPAGRLAYQVVGSGDVDLLLVPGMAANVEIRWEEPRLAHMFRRLAGSARLVLMDRRGTGLSDRDAPVPPVEDQVDDVLAVMDAAGVTRAVIFGVLDGGAIGLLTAAARPERVRGVITYACFSAFEMLGPDGGAALDEIRAQLERGIVLEDAVPALAPGRAGDAEFARWLGRYQRMAVGPGGAAATFDRWERIDIRAALADVSAPVLALHRVQDRFVPPENAEYIAAHVRDGRRVLLPGADDLLWAGDVDIVADQIERFLAGT